MSHDANLINKNYVRNEPCKVEPEIVDNVYKKLLCYL